MFRIFIRALDSDVKRKVAAGGVVSALLAASLVITLGFFGGAFWRPSPIVQHPNFPLFAIDGTVSNDFADYVPYDEAFQPDAPAYTLSPGLSNVANLGTFSYLSSNTMRMIEQNGFAVLPQDQYKQIHEILELNDDHQVPSFVSSDAVLHAFHVLYDLALREIEVYSFWDLLGNLTFSMLDSSYEQYQSAPEGRWKDAALRNMMFFTVPLLLIDNETAIPPTFPPEVEVEVEHVLELIDAHDEMTDDWFQGYKEDFTQFVPRGHYTRSPLLERYFQAMMWFGRVSFRLQPDSTPGPNEKGMNNTAQAILISLALRNEVLSLPDDITGFDVWDAIYEPTAFFVGSADDLVPAEYLTLVESIYGISPNLADLDDDALLGDFIEAALNMRAPLILGHPVLDTEEMDQTKGLRFMGQRYIPDSYILGQLVYKHVGTLMNPRLMPMGLDVMAALGSKRAWQHLDQEKAYLNYESQMEMLWDKIGNMTEEEWTHNLYYLWLYSLLPLLSDPGEGYPYFMQSEAWVDKQLNTALGSWTELRHDTILYAKQSYTWELTSMPEMVKGYVEPIPSLYARLASLCLMMIGGLDSRGLLSSMISSKLWKLHDLLRDFQAISVKELNGTPLDVEEFRLIEGSGKTLGDIVALPTDDFLVSDADDDMAVVADVHTDPNEGEVLEEAIGRPMIIYVAVQVDEQVILTRGGTFSYYEFKWPMDDRLTDEAWQEMLADGKEPAFPSWTGSFIVNQTAVVLSNNASVARQKV